MERGCCSLFKGEDIRITTDGLQQFRQMSSRFVGLRSPPVGNWGLSDGSPEPVLRRTNGDRGQRSPLIGYILLSVSGVISKPTKRCIHMLVRDCARS